MKAVTFSSVVGPTIQTLSDAQARAGAAVRDRTNGCWRTSIGSWPAGTPISTAETFAAWCLTLRASGLGQSAEPACGGPQSVSVSAPSRAATALSRTSGCFPPVHQVIRPHIFTEGEVARLLAAARRANAHRANSPLCPEMMRLAIVLLYTTGLRRRELDATDRRRLRPTRAHPDDPGIEVSQVAPDPGVGGTAREIDDVLDTAPPAAISTATRQRVAVASQSPAAIAAAASVTPCASCFDRRRSGRRLGQLPRTHDFRHALP